MGTFLEPSLPIIYGIQFTLSSGKGKFDLTGQQQDHHVLFTLAEITIDL
ncbi:MAG: hypothetical protein ACQEQO_07530 [Thermodesulfobacteriota bacterium]